MQQQSRAMRTLQSLLLDTEEGRAAVWSCLHCSPLDRVHSVRPVITLLASQMSHRIVRQNRSTTTGVCCQGRAPALGFRFRHSCRRVLQKPWPVRCMISPAELLLATRVRSSRSALPSGERLFQNCVHRQQDPATGTFSRPSSAAFNGLLSPISFWLAVVAILQHRQARVLITECCGANSRFCFVPTQAV